MIRTCAEVIECVCVREREQSVNKQKDGGVAMEIKKNHTLKLCPHFSSSLPFLLVYVLLLSQSLSLTYIFTTHMCV